MTPTRLIAAKALCRIQRDQSWSNLTLDSAIAENKLGLRDSSFVAALFYGVLERQITLDACISTHCDIKLKKLSLPVLVCLRLGIYQLLYMDKVPESAAVGESVAAAKAMKQFKSTGLINAVLRSFLRDGRRVPSPDDPNQRLSVEYSCPAELIKLWIADYGEEQALKLLERSVCRIPLYIRVNTLKTNCQTLISRLAEIGKAARQTELDNCLILEGEGTPARLAPFKEGLFYIQDKSSQLCAASLEAKPGMRVLDACCAPGSKSFTIAQIMENSGEITACDIHPHRIGLVEQGAGLLGITNIRTVACDMTIHNPDFRLFDRVLCDVPCSGLGVIRRKPELKYKPLDEFSKLPEIQYKIFKNTSQYCKPGGIMVYSTCTLRRVENEEVVERFLAESPEFFLRSVRTFLGDEDTDGFFIAVLERSA